MDIWKRDAVDLEYFLLNYPGSYAIKMATGNYCKMCGEMMMEGTKTIAEVT